MRFKIITAVWNAAQYFEGYVTSILAQGEDYDVVIVDDASTDGTADMVEDAARRNGWQYHLNSMNRGVPENQWYALRSLDARAEDVVVFVDGDDELAPNALYRLKYHYEDDTLLTYGQYRSEPFSPTCSLAGPYPQDVIDRRAYREHSLLGRGIAWNHLRTVRYETISQLTEDDFKFSDGSWYRMSADAAVMYPCLELAGDHFKYIDEVLYVYHSDNPLSEWRKAPRDGDRVHQHVLHRPPKVKVTYEQTPDAIRIRRERGMSEL